MGARIGVLCLEVVGAIYGLSIYSSTSQGTSLECGVNTRALRNQIVWGTCHGAVRELVRQDSFERVSDWVDIIQPAKPDVASKQLRLGNNIASVNNKQIERDTRETDSVINGWRQTCEHAIKSSYADGIGVDEEEVNPEFASINVEICHEVHDNSEDADLDQDDWKISDDTGDTDSGGAVESVFLLASDDGTSADGLHQFRKLEPTKEEN